MDIDTANAALFSPAEWIGTGEENKDMAPCVALARQKSTAIVLSNIRDIFPRQDEDPQYMRRALLVMEIS